jgi:hypothetical protein
MSGHASCSSCDRTWTSYIEAHCSVEGCHLHFSTIRNFDRHRRSERCVDPSLVGLVARQRVRGTTWVASEEREPPMWSARPTASSERDSGPAGDGAADAKPSDSGKSGGRNAG